MINRAVRLLSVSCLFALLTLSPTVTTRAEEELLVFAAASLTDAFSEIGDAFEADHPGVDVVINFGSSATLATQLIDGAPADVYASADWRQLRVARAEGRLDGPAWVFARNQLVVIIPADNPAHVEAVADLATPGLAFVVATPNTPIRQYTEQLLANYAADPAYGEAFRTAVLSNVMSEEGNVRLVVAKIALGEADAAVVYSSDVTPDAAESVRVIAIDDAYNVRATYPIARVRGSTHPALARAFIDYVRGATGQAILEQWGFLPASRAG